MLSAVTLTTKKPTPLSTIALAAFLTWKQFDLLLLLEQGGSMTTAALSDDLQEIHKYDIKHGGAFYTGTSREATYASMRTLENRQLIARHISRSTGLIEWTIKSRGSKALAWLTN